MPFILHVTETPPLNQILELEQIVIVDRTGPAVTLGISPGIVCLVGEFLKGGFDPAEVSSAGEILSIYGALSSILSQDKADPTTAVQDGSGIFFDGNGLLQLKSKKFKRLALCRVDTEARTAADGTTKGTVALTITFNAADLTSAVTNKDILIPAGTRVADAALATATKIVATSQDYTIPKGTAGPTATVNANVFFVKGISATAADIDTVIDAALPTVLSTITGVTNAATIYPPGTGSTLRDMIASCYVGTTGNPSAIAKTLPNGSDPTQDINVIWAARNTQAIRAALWLNAKTAAEYGRGRVACVAADPAKDSLAATALAVKTAVEGMAASEFPGIDADRALINFPYGMVYSTEMGGISVPVSADGWKASLLSNLPEEYSSGVANSIIQTLQSLEPCFVANPLTKNDYIALKAKGVSALRKDPAVGWWFQSGVTAANVTTYSTRTYDNRRRFADFVQDTLSGLASIYNKMPGTTERVDALVGEIDVFLSSLLSSNNPSQQRIEGYGIDAKSGNTPQLTGVGIRVFMVAVRMLGDLNDIIFQTEIGPTVVITQVA